MKQPELSPAPYLDENTSASHPGSVQLSEVRLRRLSPELFSVPKWMFWRKNQRANHEGWRSYFAQHLAGGDSRAAIVVQMEPILIVAAYTDELDCIALLKFSDLPKGNEKRYPPFLASELIRLHNLQIGTRLLTVNTYSPLKEGVAPDLKLGDKAHNRWGNFCPLIAEFLSDQNGFGPIEARKARIAESEWQRTLGMARAAMAEARPPLRDGRPLFSDLFAN